MKRLCLHLKAENMCNSGVCEKELFPNLAQTPFFLSHPLPVSSWLKWRLLNWAYYRAGLSLTDLGRGEQNVVMSASPGTVLVVGWDNWNTLETLVFCCFLFFYLYFSERSVQSEISSQDRVLFIWNTPFLPLSLLSAQLSSSYYFLNIHVGHKEPRE